MMWIWASVLKLGDSTLLVLYGQVQWSIINININQSFSLQPEILGQVLSESTLTIAMINLFILL